MPAAAGSPILLSVVIPTRNERDNIPTLLDQLSAALPAGDTEVVFVDDSTDTTPHVIEVAAGARTTPVTVHHRRHAAGGLGGAVVEGLRLARGAWVVVMDADLQHPPALVPALLAAAQATGADLVIASRHAAGGASDGLSGRYRRLVSRASTTIAKLAFRRTLAQVSDPMSGFFALRAAAVDADELQPLGYKILLELIVRARPARIEEVPYTFQPRHAGRSKSSLREGLRFLRHLSVLRLGSSRARMLGFGMIGLSGLVPNAAALWLLAAVLGMHYLPAAVLANQVAIGWNFLHTDLLLFRGQRRGRTMTRLTRFAALANLDLLARVPAMFLLVSLLHLGYLLATLTTLVTSFLVRFTVVDRRIYAPDRPSARTTADVPSQP